MKFEKKKELALKKAQKIKEKNELREIKNKYKRKPEKFTMTKKIICFILFNCTIVELYSMAVMVAFRDLSALYSLIGAVISESISFAIYCAKSFNETREENRISLDRDKFYHEAGIELDENGVPVEGSGDIPEDATEGIYEDNEETEEVDENDIY